MRKLFCGISVFLFLGLLSYGYYESYRIALLRNKVPSTEEYSSVPKEEHPVPVDAGESPEQFGNYCLKENDGMVQVYLSDEKTLYEKTEIPVSELPESLQKKIREGYFLKDQEALYGFLENYSS